MVGPDQTGIRPYGSIGNAVGRFDIQYLVTTSGYCQYCKDDCKYLFHIVSFKLELDSCSKVKNALLRIAEVVAADFRVTPLDLLGPGQDIESADIESAGVEADTAHDTLGNGIA